MNFKEDTENLIDNLKAVCKSYGLGNDGNEYKIITQVFLYKFLNDKFTYEIKKVEKSFDKQGWEADYLKMTEEEREDVLSRLNADVPVFYPEHLLTNLWNSQNRGDFDEIFDNTMLDIADKNKDIFSTKSTEETVILLFEKLTPFVTDDNQRAPFARALVSKLNSFSFEEAFEKEKGNYDFFAKIFEYLIKDYNTAGGGKYAEYYTPLSIARIMARLLVGNDKDLHSVTCYDPSAGTGTLLMALAHQIGENQCTIYSQDISQRSNKLLKLNLILNGLILSLDNAVQGNTLTHPYHKNDRGNALRQFDFIVSNPPFKMDYSEDYTQILSQGSRFWAGVPNIPKKEKEKMAIYPLFIQHVINSLKPSTGKGAVVVPTGFITAKGGVENRILKRIVDDKLVYGVISMPSNVFATTGTNVSVLFLSKREKKEDDKVILIDASKLGETYKEGKNQKCKLRDFEIDKIVDTFNSKEVVDDFSVAVSYDQIKEKNYSLSAGQYFDIKIDHIDITKEEFQEKMNSYQKELEDYFKESEKLSKEILEALKKVKYE